ncbi:hypothetical protein PF005_g15597 [Phytophthora fragariae]|uniref:Uncharacterized protein n=1 Tax=Phytophthora fragariae TaxID=53985 RepID=A0A6A3XK11_9STRA|nr:hypothetical protein PF005_g15597 [Phytophthora fragariae]
MVTPLPKAIASALMSWRCSFASSSKLASIPFITCFFKAFAASITSTVGSTSPSFTL